MSDHENRRSFTCPICKKQAWVDKCELDKCNYCLYEADLGKGMIDGVNNRISKCINDVAKFDFDHGIPYENDPTMSNLMYNALCLAGEGGEVANVVKKIWRDGDSEAARIHLHEEIVDCMIFICKLAMISEMNFDEAWKAKHKELYIRWRDKKIGRRKVNLQEVSQSPQITGKRASLFIINDMQVPAEAALLSRYPAICNECSKNPMSCGFRTINENNCGADSRIGSGFNQRTGSGFNPYK